uniref:Uncharacterized protein n=1 Tax=viral metagenome TaxID=1070528 RepID=A0A6M3JJ16_9ZZZZ
MLYLVAFAAGVLFGVLIMSLCAISGTQDKIIEADELHAINQRLCARLDGRTVTLHDETGLAVEMPVEHRMEEVA